MCTIGGAGPGLCRAHRTAAVILSETVGVSAKIILSAYEKGNKTIKLVLYYCTLESCILEILISGTGCHDVICFWGTRGRCSIVCAILLDVNINMDCKSS